MCIYLHHPQLNTEKQQLVLISLLVKMVHALSFLALVVCSTAVQGYFIQSNADANTVDVGHFKSMNEFCKTQTTYVRF